MTGARAIADSRDGSKPWLIAGAACALAATGALMLTDEARWLRLGIVAALWAALLGAFLATKYRKSAEHAWGSVNDAQHIYELELEREITARREYELELEASTRRRVEHETYSEIQDLRTEVMALRDSLQQLLEGDVVYERVALTEQSTRRRSMREEQNGVASGGDGSGPRLVSGGDGSGPRLVSGTTTALEEVADQRTQVISRVVTSSAPRSRRARPPVVDEPQYEPYPQEPQQAPVYDDFPAEPAPPAEPVQARYYRAELPTGSQPDDELALPEHQSASEFSLADYSNGSGDDGARKYEFPAFSLFEEQAQEPFDAFGSNGAAQVGGDNGYGGHVAPDAAFAANGHGANGRHQPPPQPPKRPHNDGTDTGDLSALIAENGPRSGGRAARRANHAADRGDYAADRGGQGGHHAAHANNVSQLADHARWPDNSVADHGDRGDQGGHHAAHGGQAGQWASPAQPQPQQSQQEHSWFTPASPVASQENGHAGGARRESAPAPNQSLPPGALEIQRQGRPGGRRRKADPEDAAMAPAGPSEPVVPETPTVRAVSSSQDDYSFPGVNGRHVGHQQESFPSHGAGQPAPRAAMDEEASGSHASGRSVHDLLAAHGRGTPARRHRYKD